MLSYEQKPFAAQSTGHKNSLSFAQPSIPDYKNGLYSSNPDQDESHMKSNKSMLTVQSKFCNNH